MNTNKIAVIMLAVGTALLIPTILLAIYVDSAVSTLLLILSVIINAIAVNILIIGAQRRRRKLKARGRKTQK